MVTNVGFPLGDDDSGFDEERWSPNVGQEDLISGLEDFLALTCEPDSPEAFKRIRSDANNRVVLSRINVEGLGDVEG